MLFYAALKSTEPAPAETLCSKQARRADRHFDRCRYSFERRPWALQSNLPRSSGTFLRGFL